MKKANRADILKAAWKLARIGQKKFGGNVKEYMSEALKLAWSIVKSTVYVPYWFLMKKDIFAANEMNKCKIVKETEKAYFVTTMYNDTTWVQKSITEKFYAL